MPKDWEAIRASRPDLTDYVTHFTKAHPQQDGTWIGAKDSLLSIMRAGAITPTFAPRTHTYSGQIQNPTVRGPYPAVCLTEQTLWACNASRHIAGRYSGYGIAYHKYLLHMYGGRPVIYGTKDELAGLSDELKYRFVTYKPEYPGSGIYPVDFTWEMEWRFVARIRTLPIALPHGYPNLLGGAIVVERDQDVKEFSDTLCAIRDGGTEWPKFIGKIVSLETVSREMAAGNNQYARIETYP